MSGQRLLRLLLFSLLVPLAVSAQEVPLAPDTLVVARVNGVAIRAGQFRSTYVESLISTGSNDTPASRQNHLNRLIDTHLMAQEAQRRGLEGTPAFQDFADRRIRHLVGSRYFARAFLDSLPAPAEAEVREAYRRQHETRQLRQLFFRDAGQARTAYERLEAGADFVQLANELYRTPRFDSLAGVLGTAGYWELDDAVAEAVYATPVGHYTPPVRSRFGWHIVRVEDRLYNPLLVESDFQARRGAVAARLRERRYRTEGSRFIEEMMAGVNVELNRTALAQLQRAVRQQTGAVESADLDAPLLDEEVVRLREVLTPETVLATYRLDGRQYALTAADYARRLPELPGREVRASVAASVGRVLRDEVLAEHGFAEGLDADAGVQHDLQHLTATFLAALLAEQLRADTVAVPTEAELSRAFAALGGDAVQRATADFWFAPFPTRAQAVQALEALQGPAARPDTLRAYTHYQGIDLAALGDLGRHVRLAPLGQTTVLGLADDTWMLLHVQARNVERATLDDQRSALTQRLKPHLAQMRLLADLRARADIEIDPGVWERVLPALQ